MSAPRSASVVIVGAGCIGASIAYHLARRGVQGRGGAGARAVRGRRLDRPRRRAGSGPSSRLRSTCKISMLSIEFYERFAEEMETARRCSSRSATCSCSPTSRAGRHSSGRPTCSASLGLDVRTLTPAEARVMVPELRVDDLLGATFCTRVTGWRIRTRSRRATSPRPARLGARFEFDRAVTGLEREGDRVVAVQTAAGRIARRLGGERGRTPRRRGRALGGRRSAGAADPPTLLHHRAAAVRSRSAADDRGHEIGRLHAPRERRRAAGPREPRGAARLRHQRELGLARARGRARHPSRAGARERARSRTRGRGSTRPRPITTRCWARRPVSPG